MKNSEQKNNPARKANPKANPKVASELVSETATDANILESILESILEQPAESGSQLPSGLYNTLHKPLCEAEDLASCEHLQSEDGATAIEKPGEPNFLRGPYATMYRGKAWTTRQYAGFSTASSSNSFYHQALKRGQRGLSVAFDLPTHRGYDSDHARVSGDVGKAGVAIDSVEDMKLLFAGIPLDQVSVSMTMSGAVLPIMAFFIVAAEEQGVKRSVLTGTIQNDILKEFLVRNTYIYAPRPSMRVLADIIRFTTSEMKKFNPISISGYHFQEAGASPVLELGLTLADGLEYVRVAKSCGLSVEEFAPRLSFFFGIGMQFLAESVKLRAARFLWAKLIREKFKVKNPDALRLRTHCQTSGVSLTAQDPYNNIVRTTLEALAAVLGGTQSLHTNAFDEAIALPSDFSSHIALNTQLILQNESGITNAIDPLAGSYYFESLTAQMIKQAEEIINAIEREGGMLAALKAGTASRWIASQAAEKQARLDSKQELLVGVNAFTHDDNNAPPLETLSVNLQEVLQQQKQSLKEVKAMREPKKHADALVALEKACAIENEGLLEHVIVATRARATLGEISDALARGLGGRYSQSTHAPSGIYGKAFAVASPKTLEDLQKTTRDFAKEEGRRPRLLVVKLGQDGHDRGARTVAAAFADFGFDVDIAPLFQTPREAARQAIDNDVHIIGVSTQAGAHEALVPQLMAYLKEDQKQEQDEEQDENILVVCGGVIPPQDHAALLKSGVFAIFGPGSNLATAASDVLLELKRRVAKNN